MSRACKWRVVESLAIVRTAVYYLDRHIAFISPCMEQQKRRFVNVDELLPQITLQQVAAYYGVALPELKMTNEEIRMTKE